LSDRMKVDEVGGKCCMNGGGMHTGFRSDRSEDLGVGCDDNIKTDVKEIGED
jgi:hypothetical protein